MTEAGLYDIYSAEALDRIQQAGGYTHGDLTDSITGRSLWVEELDVPLVIANVTLEAHSQARARQRYLVTPWEATLEDLCDDLLVRCAALEQQLRERR